LGTKSLCKIHGNKEADKYARKVVNGTETTKINLSAFIDIKKKINTNLHFYYLAWILEKWKLREIKQNILSWKFFRMSRKEEIIFN